MLTTPDDSERQPHGPQLGSQALPKYTHPKSLNVSLGGLTHGSDTGLGDTIYGPSFSDGLML